MGENNIMIGVKAGYNTSSSNNIAISKLGRLRTNELFRLQEKKEKWEKLIKTLENL